MNRLAIAFFSFALLLGSQGRGGLAPKAMLPEGPGKGTVQQVCGSTCHGPEIIAGKGYSRESWAGVMNGMIARGAKADTKEFGEVLDYLAKNLPPKTGKAGAGGVGFIGSGSDDAHLVDGEAADRGKAVYVAECITCHGARARGGPDSLPPPQRGSDLVRSLVVLKDRYGATIGEFLKKGHPLQSGKASASLSGAQVIDLSHFLHLKVNDTLRSGPFSQVINVLTGDVTAGRIYFTGAGGCTKCHSVTGDLAGIGRRYEAPALQQKFLFPRSFQVGRGGQVANHNQPVTLTVTASGSPAVSGTLVFMDDFHVSLRDAAGEYHTWTRSSAVKVDKTDPYAGHIQLLDKYTDKNIHDLVAYMVTLK